MEKLKVITFNCRTTVDGDLRPGQGLQFFEFNKKNGELQRVALKPMKTRWIDKQLLKWFGTVKSYPDSYFFHALNMKNARNLIIKKYNPSYIQIIE